MKKRVRRAVTLIEMIVVMTLIAIITSAITYNYQASLDQGKAFKTKEMINRLETIIALEMASRDMEPSKIQNENWKQIVVDSPLWGGSKKTEEIKDGWGAAIKLHVDAAGAVKFTSEKLDKYEAKKPVATRKPKYHNTGASEG